MTENEMCPGCNERVRLQDDVCGDKNCECRNGHPMQMVHENGTPECD